MIDMGREYVYMYWVMRARIKKESREKEMY